MSFDYFYEPLWRWVLGGAGAEGKGEWRSSGEGVEGAEEMS